MAKKTDKVDNLHINEPKPETVDLDFVEKILAEDKAEKDAEKADETKPAWARFPKKSMDKVKEAGYILPELKLRKGASYSVILIEAPKLIQTKKGDFFVCKVDDREMIKTCKCNASFRFSLDAEVEKYKLSYDQLIGLNLIIQKNDSGMVSVQIKQK
jgi:hypothetical protein